MIVKLKHLLVVETIIILVLAGNFVYDKYSEKQNQIQSEEGFLSPRIYHGLLEPKSRLITNFLPLREQIEAYFQKNNITGSLYVENLRNGAYTGINEKIGYF